LVDIDIEDSPDQEVAAVLHELSAADSPQVAVRKHGRYLARLETTVAQDDRRAQAFCLATRRPGFVGDLHFRTTLRHPPRPTELEIEVIYGAVGFPDVMVATGMLREDPTLGVLGRECVGRVVRLGREVRDLAVGDWVAAIGVLGIGSHVTVDRSLVARAPDQSPATAALCGPFVTARLALLHLARLEPGERVLIHSAATGVGAAALQVAQRAGALVVATAGDDRRRGELRGRGVKYVFDSRTGTFFDEIRTLFPDGIDVVLNSLTGDAKAFGMALLRPGGRFIDLDLRGITPSVHAPSPTPNVVHCRFDLQSLARQNSRLVQKTLEEVLSDAVGTRIEPLPYRLYDLDSVASAFRAMAQAQHGARHVLDFAARPARVEPARADELSLRSDATYLVTGGHGAVGQAIAIWLIQHGARSIALCGRTARASSDELARAASGHRAEVRCIQADVADAADVEDLLARLRRPGVPPLRGVFHAAGVLDDGLVGDQNLERFDKVFGGKAMGAWHLHRLIDEPLDLFVLISSVASVLGTPGQANYAAANSVLDALAQTRRAAGLPAISINFGPWGEAGMASQRAMQLRANALGVSSFSLTAGVSALEAAIQSGAIQTVAIQVRWSQLARSLPGLANTPYLDDLTVRQWVAHDHAAAHQERGMLELAAPEERPTLATTMLQSLVAEALRISTDQVDPRLSLTASGVDSLLALEIKNGIFRTFGAALDARTLLRAPNLPALAGDLLHAMSLDVAEAGSAATDRPRRRVCSWFVRTPGREDAAVRLFCAPFAGGGAQVFREWARWLPDNIEPVSIELPGRGQRFDEPLHRSLEPLVSRLADEMFPLLDRPFAFFGHCMGALVMFELTRLLRRTRGLSPIHLFASACPPPDDYIVPSLDPGTHRYVRERGSSQRRLVPIHALRDAEFLDVLRFLSFGPGSALFEERELLLEALPVLRADFEVCSTYRFTREQPLDVPLTALVGDEDPFAGPAEGNAWGRLTQATFEVRVHPGDHYYLFPRTPFILAHVRESIEQSDVFKATGTFRSGVPPARSAQSTAPLAVERKK
jgi:surfactin synthase thioesterase subunit/NADPH:quinone reductase-like Zn-dependent oxidoreductase